MCTAWQPISQLGNLARVEKIPLIMNASSLAISCERIILSGNRKKHPFFCNEVALLKKINNSINNKKIYNIQTITPTEINYYLHLLGCNEIDKYSSHYRLIAYFINLSLLQNRHATLTYQHATSYK